MALSSETQLELNKEELGLSLTDSLLVVRIDSFYQTKGSFVIEPPAYDTSIIQQCDDHHLTSHIIEQWHTSTITWYERNSTPTFPRKHIIEV